MGGKTNSAIPNRLTVYGRRTKKPHPVQINYKKKNKKKKQIDKHEKDKNKHYSDICIGYYLSEEKIEPGILILQIIILTW